MTENSTQVFKRKHAVSTLYPIVKLANNDKYKKKEKLPSKKFQGQNATGTSVLIPADMTGSRMATTATFGALTRRTGLMPKISAKMKVDTWPLSPPMPPNNMWTRG